MNTSHFLAFIAGIAATAALAACNRVSTTDSQADSVEPADESRTLATEDYSDLKMFELKGPVKECTKRSYYGVKVSGNKLDVDTSSTTTRDTQMYFDKIGNYVVSDYEKIERDDKGRIVHWRDTRPNNIGTHPGMLLDSLRYTHLNNNVLQSKGMGEFAITVYDNEGRIVGQYSDPEVDGTQMAAFNVYRTFDEHGNWTERMTVWTTQSAGSRPHVSYTLDRRTITYY